MRNMPAISAMDRSAALEMQPEHSPGSALQRPRSVAQKAGMNVWSRHAARYGSAFPPAIQHASRHSAVMNLCYAPLHHARGNDQYGGSCWVACLSCCRWSVTSSAVIHDRLMLHR